MVYIFLPLSKFFSFFSKGEIKVAFAWSYPSIVLAISYAGVPPLGKVPSTGFLFTGFPPKPLAPSVL